MYEDNTGISDLGWLMAVVFAVGVATGALVTVLCT